MEKIVEKYFRPKLPHIWCPGCGNGIVTGAIAQAIDKMGLDQSALGHMPVWRGCLDSGHA